MGMMEITIHNDVTAFIAENCMRCKIREDVKEMQDGKDFWQKLYCPQMEIISYRGKAWYPQTCPNFVKRPLNDKEKAELNEIFDELLDEKKE